MTKLIYMKRYLLFLGLLSMVSCKKYLDVNTDPNNATVTKANYVFTNALAVTAGNQVGGAHALGSTWTGYWAHSTSFTGGGQEKTYIFTNNDFDYFTGLYDNATDYQYVIDHAAADGFPHLVGPAKIMLALVYQRLVDLYGDVPYTQALQGTKFTYPKFDDAKTIYEDLVTKINSGIADVNSATWPLSESADIMFKGNKTLWIQLANTLKLRIVMRQSNMAGRDSYITGVINAISGGFLTDNAYVNPGYTKTAGKLNPFYGNWGYDQNDAQTGNFAYRKMNAVIINWLKNSGDIFRLQRIATPKGTSVPSSNPGDYQGVPMGSPTGYLEAVCSSIGSEQIVLGDASRASILMTAAEAYFLRAEAFAKYGIASVGTDASNYTSGVRSAFRLAAATQAGTGTSTNSAADAAADAYIAGSSPTNGVYINYASATTTADKLKAIWVQKWVALCNIDGLESWAEYRRTNTTNAAGAVLTYGNCPYSPKSVAATSPGGAEPVRLFYPLREESVNSANVPHPAGFSVFTSKIFWDAN
jgi:hypothetical protein